VLDSEYVIMPEHETVPMARGYRIMKDPESGEYLALRGSETGNPQSETYLVA